MAKSKPKPKRAGRPFAIVADDKTLAQIKGLANIQCTTREAAAVLNVSEHTFLDFMKREPNARETWDNGKEVGKASLRRTQFRLAETNVAMAIWLGKQLLGQRDVTELHGKDGAPLIQPVINLTIGNERKAYSG